ncbi:MAG: DUF3696 domain-containing protein, partial [Deltaproteobacteria bacterium]|nr:DUF3696 domain-containing protein [Deltaproteobacteria bacterium]
HGATDPCGCLFRHFFPSAIVCAVNAIEENVKAISHALRFWSLTGVPVQNDALPEIVLSKEMIAALRNILGMKKKFDLTPKVQEPQNSLSSSEPISFRRWYENLLRLPVDELGQIRQAVNSCGNLSDHLYAALKSAAQKFKPRAFVKKGLPILLSDAFRQAEDVFVGSLKYLGPLRAAPRPPYLLATDVDLDDAGIGGEHAAVIFELHKKKPVKYIPSAHFQDHSIDPKPIASTLEAAATDWLERLGLASSVKCRAQGKWGHELKVTLSPSDAPHDLRQAGSGVSQVLPIIVMGLLADSDSTLIFEHPELHLHPKVQTLLGDFFLSMALCGKQCLVETHSEYLIDRLRFRIAAASPENELHSLAKIYFAEKAPQGSTFREVVINEYGAITDWPEGFFDESQEQAEKILMAATRKRKAERKNKEA